MNKVKHYNADNMHKSSIMVFYPTFFDFFQVFLDKIVFDYLYIDQSNVTLIMEENKKYRWQRL